MKTQNKVKKTHIKVRKTIPSMLEIDIVYTFNKCDKTKLHFDEVIVIDVSNNCFQSGRHVFV